MSSFILGASSGSISILFETKYDGREGKNNVIIFTNSARNGTMFGKAIEVPEEYFYNLLGELEYFEEISSRRRPNFSLYEVEEEEREFSVDFEKKVFLQSGFLVFRFSEGILNALLLSSELKEKALHFLKNEEFVQKDSSRRAQEGAFLSSGM